MQKKLLTKDFKRQKITWQDLISKSQDPDTEVFYKFSDNKISNILKHKIDYINIIEECHSKQCNMCKYGNIF